MCTTWGTPLTKVLDPLLWRKLPKALFKLVGQHFHKNKKCCSLPNTVMSATNDFPVP